MVFPSLVLPCSSTAAVLKNSSSSCARDAHQVQGRPKEQKLPWARSTQAPRQPQMCLWFWMREHPQLLLLRHIYNPELCHKPPSPKSSHCQEMPRQPCKTSHISDSTLFSPRQVTNLAEPYPQQLQHHRVQGKLMQPTQSLFTQSDRIFPVSEVLKKARVKSHLSPPSPKTNGVKN